MTDPNAQIPDQISAKANVLSFYYRRTEMGGFNDTIVLSFRTKRPIKSALRTSRSGHHGSRLYRLFPAKYLVYAVERSNLGNLYCTISIIKVNEDGGIRVEKDWEVCRQNEQLLYLDDLPSEIREILLENKDELPLFNRIFLQDIQEGE